MFERRRELIKYWRREREVRNERRRVIRELRAEDASDDKILGETIHFDKELEDLDYFRRRLNDRRLIRRARRLSIEPPPFTHQDDEPSWEMVTEWKIWVLKPNAVRALRAEIREELKARRDYLLGWISPFVGILAALAGAIAGFLLGRKT